jgi:hypothetical protein
VEAAATASESTSAATEAAAARTEATASRTESASAGAVGATVVKGLPAKSGGPIQRAAR